MTKPIWEWSIFSPSRLLFAMLLCFCLATTSATVLAFEPIEEDEKGFVVNPSGEVVRTLDPGWHFVIPLYEDVEVVPQTTTVRGETGAITRDGVLVEVEYQTQLTVSNEEALEFYQTYGADSERAATIYSDPCTREALRNTTAQYDVEAVYGNVTMLQDAVSSCDSGEFDVQVRNVRFPGAFETTIQQKAQAQEVVEQQQTANTTTA